MTFTWGKIDIGWSVGIGSSSAGRTKVERGGGKDRGGIKQTCKEELMRTRVYGMGDGMASRATWIMDGLTRQPRRYTHRQWPSPSSLPSFLPSFLSHPSRFIVIPNLLSGISSASRVVYTVRRRRKHNTHRGEREKPCVESTRERVDRSIRRLERGDVFTSRVKK